VLQSAPRERFDPNGKEWVEEYLEQLGEDDDKKHWVEEYLEQPGDDDSDDSDACYVTVSPSDRLQNLQTLNTTSANGTAPRSSTESSRQLSSSPSASNYSTTKSVATPYKLPPMVSTRQHCILRNKST
jgi:hypothetical protein